MEDFDDEEPIDRPNVEETLEWVKYSETDVRCKPFVFVGTLQI